jgi:ParB family chromosome partitioning protein
MGEVVSLSPIADLAIGSQTYDRMCVAIAECERVDEAIEIVDRAAGLAEYARRAKNYEAERAAQNIRLEAECRAGEILETLERATPAEAVSTRYAPRDGDRSTPTPYAAALAENGISTQDASRFQKLAAIPKPEFKAALAAPEKPTTRGLLDKAAHRVNFTGENEWYTPPAVLEAARLALGEIDLDPASSAKAQETVRAARYFTADDDGLSLPWRGRVWLNPPYAQPLISHFVDKLIAELAAGRTTEAVLLTHNYTDTGWFIRAGEAASAIGFSRGRIRFVSRAGDLASPTQGQALLYFGARPAAFVAAFRALAWFPPGTPRDG